MVEDKFRSADCRHIGVLAGLQRNEPARQARRRFDQGRSIRHGPRDQHRDQLLCYGSLGNRLLDSTTVISVDGVIQDRGHGEE